MMSKPTWWIVALTLPLAQITVPGRLADFSRGIPPAWQSRAFVGHTQYEHVQTEGGHWAVRATARDAASALGVRVRVHVRSRDRPIIRWRWKAERLPAGGDETAKRTDDVAARLLLVFNDSRRSSRLKTICYVWANRLQPGGTINSPVSSNVKIVAVESGAAAVGQ